MTIEEYFETGPEFERPIYEAVATHMASLEGVHTEPVSVGIFFKRTFAQLRTMTRWVALSFILERKLESNRLSRKVQSAGDRYYHVVNVKGPEDIDDQILEWITEAWAIDI
jgi:hypothetical protein